MTLFLFKFFLSKFVTNRNNPFVISKDSRNIIQLISIAWYNFTKFKISCMQIFIEYIHYTIGWSTVYNYYSLYTIHA